MTALPTVNLESRLALLPRLTQAAAAALDTDASEILRRWFAGLGSSARTKYGQALRQFATWATGDQDPAPDATLRLLVDAGRVGARQMAIGWRDSLLAAGKASGTVAGLVSALASLVTACRLCGLVEWHLESIAPKVEPRHDRSGPPRHQIEQLLAMLDELAATGDRRAARDVAIVRLLHNCAFRRNEVSTLRMQDLDMQHADGPRVLALRKGHKERQPMAIGRKAAESLAAWLAVRGDHPGPVFHRVRGLQDAATAGPLSGEAIRQMLRQRAREAGCRATFRPHGMRHSAATHAARNGSLATLKALGGWKSLSAPARYLDDAGRDRQTAIVLVEV
jgi:integrase/recombinase XerD